MTENHLVVLVHGLWGSASNLDRVDKVLHLMFEDNPDVKLHTFAPETFSQFKSYDGVKHIGNLVIKSLFKELELLQLKEVSIDTISFIGYSFGGLISRYVIGELFEVGFFEVIKPIFFTTFATPHLGTRFFSSQGRQAPILNFLGSNLLGQSGRDLFLKGGEDSILYKLALNDGKYHKALKTFKKLITFANIRYDRTVAFHTSYMTEYDVFNDWEHVNLETSEGLPTAHILDDQGGKLQHIETQIVDLAKSVRAKDGPLINGQYEGNGNKRKLLLLFGIVTIFPLVLTISSFATLKSFFRINFSPKFDIEEEWRTIKLVLEKKSVLSDNELDSLLSHEDNNNIDLEIPTQKIADTTREIVEDGLFFEDQSPKDDIFEDNDDISSDCFYHIDCDFKVHCENEDDAVSLMLRYGDFDISESPLTQGLEPLAFNEIQSTINKHLNELDWVKFPVYLPSFNAHQTIVGRRGFVRTSQGIPLLFLYGYYVKKMLTSDTTAL